MKPPRKRANNNKKRVDLSFFFFSKKAENLNQNKGNDSCDVYLILSNSGKYLRELKIYQVSDHVIFRSSFKLAFVKV